MTDLFEASVTRSGRRLERAAARDGSRGIGVAVRGGDGARELVTVVGPELAEQAMAEHPGWDLPLASVDRVETSSGPRTVVAESLPSGVPSTWLAPRDPSRSDPLPPYAVELARRVAADHADGRVVGRLHAATVIVDPETFRLEAVAQRPLRIAGAIAVEGDRPLLGYGSWAPGDVRGTSATPADDVFRLAILCWQWRHGASPLGAATDGELRAILGRLDAGEPAALPAPDDDVDGVLLACLGPAPTARPSAHELADVLRGHAGT